MLFYFRSPLLTSIDYASSNIDISQRIYNLIAKVFIFSGSVLQGSGNELLMKIYDNRNVIEPIESKIIRYSVIIKNKPKQASSGN